MQKALEDHIDIYLQPFEAEQKLKTYKYMTEILFGGYDGIPNEIPNLAIQRSFIAFVLKYCEQRKNKKEYLSIPNAPLLGCSLLE